jgi:hypothetical protein
LNKSRKESHEKYRHEGSVTHSKKRKMWSELQAFAEKQSRIQSLDEVRNVLEEAFRAILEQWSELFLNQPPETTNLPELLRKSNQEIRLGRVKHHPQTIDIFQHQWKESALCMAEVAQWRQGHREILFFLDRNFLDVLDSEKRRKKLKLPPPFVAQSPLSLFLRCSWVLYVHHSKAGGAVLWSNVIQNMLAVLFRKTSQKTSQKTCQTEAKLPFEPFVFDLCYFWQATSNGEDSRWYPLNPEGTLVSKDEQQNQPLTASGHPLHWKDLHRNELLQLGWRGRALPLSRFRYLPPLLWTRDEQYRKSREMERLETPRCCCSCMRGPFVDSVVTSRKNRSNLRQMQATPPLSPKKLNIN